MDSSIYRCPIYICPACIVPGRWRESTARDALHPLHTSSHPCSVHTLLSMLTSPMYSSKTPSTRYSQAWNLCKLSRGLMSAENLALPSICPFLIWIRCRRVWAPVHVSGRHVHCLGHICLGWFDVEMLGRASLRGPILLRAHDTRLMTCGEHLCICLRDMARDRKSTVRTVEAEKGISLGRRYQPWNQSVDTVPDVGVCLRT